jgi:hypothetical protein
MYVSKTIPFLLTSVLIISLFTGCVEKQIEVKTVEDERIKLNLSEPNQLKLKPVTFYVLTDKNKDVIFKQLESQNKDKVLIGLTDDDYQKISENLLLIQNYIVQQRLIIKSYKDYYENAPSQDLNTSNKAD